MDELLFLVRCMERRLSLTSPAAAPRALSVLRQIYYGSSSWTVAAGRNPLWDSVIPTRPWAAGTDPSTTLGPLLGALQRSQTVEGTDIGHALAGLDAMLARDNIDIQFGRVTVGSTRSATNRIDHSGPGIDRREICCDRSDRSSVALAQTSICWADERTAMLDLAWEGW